ncbi:MAG: peptidoglycan-binding protein [Rhodoplanes sp.]
MPKDDPNWKGPFDCAEFMSWLVYQEAGILYGCTDDNAQPSQADAYTGGWRTDVGRRGIRVSVDKAAATVGGIVLRYPPPRGMGHIALCDGKGGTVEAKGKKYGVVADTVHGRGWHTGVLIPGINYDEPDPDIRPVKRPDVTYARNAPNMDRAIIIEIQKALASKGFSPGENDGEFGEVTEAAVVDFQESEGLVVDGEVGRATAEALGVSLESPGSSSPDGPLKKIEKPIDIILGLGVGTMNPFIMIAARLLPGIIQAIAGDKAGTVAGAVTKADTDITRAKNPEEAQDKLKADPDAYAALQLKLAEIANDYELARRKAELDLFKEQNKAEAERREAELKEFRAQLEDTKGARSTFSQLALANNPMAWGAPIVSFIVTLGFFGILVILMTVEAQFNPDNGQIINIAIGALAAGFATVISFWLGSSQGSRFKDVAASELQERQAQQNAAVLKQAEATMKTVIDKKSAAKAQKPPDQLRRCLDIVLWQEEGVSDRAGITKFGITLEELQSSRGKSVTEAELTTLTRQQACEIYRMRYWNIMRCDELPIGVDLVVFDLAADLSLSESARMLQQVVGAADDGAIGPVTMGAVDLATPRDIVTRMSELRREHKRNLADGSGKEGMSRITEVENAALRMIDAASAAAV